MEEVVKKVSKFWWIMLVLLILSIGSCTIGMKAESKLNDRTSYDATLVQAYSSMQGCGKHKSCEEFMGRFKLKSGQYVNREIDGFFYHNYVDKGRVDMPAYVTLSTRDLGGEGPWWTWWCIIFGGICGSLVAASLITKGLGDL